MSPTCPFQNLPSPSLSFKKQIWDLYLQPSSHFSSSPPSSSPAVRWAAGLGLTKAANKRHGGGAVGGAPRGGALSPPDDPKSLLSAALVSKRWCRLICGRRFRCRFRKFHGTPPLLGFLHRRGPTELERLFIPSSSFRPCDHAYRHNLKAVHSCHGCVLLNSSVPSYYESDTLEDLFVWDPVTNKLRKLPRWPLHSIIPAIEGNGNAAVLCAVLGDGCDHLDCHHGPFMVVLAGFDEHAQTFISVYSSEADRWSKPIYTGQYYDYIEKGNSVLIGSAVYFRCLTMSRAQSAILKYDLLSQEISEIPIPRVGILEHINYEYIVLMAMEDGRLGFAGMRNCSTLSLWSRMHHGPDDEDARWAQSRVIELVDMLLPTTKFRKACAHVVAFADTGAGGGVIFIWSTGGLYSLHLKSGSCRKVLGTYGPMGDAVPYFSFCTPALAAISIDEGPGADEPSA